MSCFTSRAVILLNLPHVLFLYSGNLSLKALLVGHLRDIRFENYEIHPLQMCVGVDFLLPNLTLRTEYYDVDITLDLEDGGDDKFRIFGAGIGR